MATIASRRVLAFVVDWLVVAVWGGALFGAAMMTPTSNPPLKAPWEEQIVSLLTMTIPVTLYFAICESSAWRGSLGKRTLGLRVFTASGQPLSFRRSCIRNAIKFAPWELGHALAWRIARPAEAGFDAGAWSLMILAYGGAAWWLVALIVSGRAPYDQWSRTRIMRIAHHMRGATSH